jgi:hypothetical protein
MPPAVEPKGATAMKFESTIAVLLALLLAPISAFAMNRLDALGLIESGNNDFAVGTHQEVSRYQIQTDLWKQTCDENGLAGKGLMPTNPADARLVVEIIMKARCSAFESRYHHAPDDFEFYLLWHRPACYIGRSMSRAVTAVEADRARRFARLCRNPE